MTANQIMIPVIVIAVVVFAVVMFVRNSRKKARHTPKTHGPNSPASQNDKGAMARSAHSGYTGSER